MISLAPTLRRASRYFPPFPMITTNAYHFLLECQLLRFVNYCLQIILILIPTLLLISIGRIHITIQMTWCRACCRSPPSEWWLANEPGWLIMGVVQFVPILPICSAPPTPRCPYRCSLGTVFGDMYWVLSPDTSVNWRPIFATNRFTMNWNDTPTSAATATKYLESSLSYISTP